jgi:hypothetical protein
VLVENDPIDRLEVRFVPSTSYVDYAIRAAYFWYSSGTRHFFAFLAG